MKWQRYPKYKDSGIEWLGEVPEHWDFTRSKWVFRELNNRSTNGDEELLTVSHITGVTPRSVKEVNMFMAETLEGYKKCQKGDLVINTMWAWMGALGIAFNDGIVSPSYNTYRFRSQNVVPKYFDMLFRTPNFINEIIRYSKGIWSSRLRLYPEEFFKIIIITPPKEEQSAIASFLDRETTRIDTLIEKKEKQMALLKEKRAALISHAVTKGLDPNVKMKNSGIEWLGEIPEGWGISRSKYIFKILNGSTPKSSKPLYWDGTILWATPDDLGNLDGDTLYETQRSITVDGYNSCGTTLGPKYSLILSTRAPIGHLAITGNPMCCNQGCRILVPHNKKNFKFYYYLLCALRPGLEAWGQGSTFKELSRTKLENIYVILPPYYEQSKIAAFLDRETGKIDTLGKKIKQSIDLLKEYRTAIISAAVTGKIDVRDLPCLSRMALS